MTKIASFDKFTSIFARLAMDLFLMKKTVIYMAIALASTTSLFAIAADVQRQSEVAERGKDIMPFSLKATTHIFTKTAEGGIQRVVAKNAADESQTKLVRTHLQEIKQQFLSGDFSDPSHIHGNDMPGLDELRSAKPGQIAIDYRNIPGGGELVYRTSNAVLVAALHNWFDAQISDHGADAMDGHHRRHRDMPMK